jgi:hypothetical protein
VDQDRKLVASQAGHHVARTHMVLNAARHLDQELVTGRVAHAVVDELETIEVKEHHTEVVTGVFVTCVERLLELLDETAPVGQACQAVVKGDVIELRLGVPPCADVLHLQDQAGRVGIGLIEEAAVERHPKLGTLLVTTTHLDGKRFDAAVADAIECFVEGMLIVFDHEVCEAMINDGGGVGTTQQ